MAEKRARTIGVGEERYGGADNCCEVACTRVIMLCGRQKRTTRLNIVIAEVFFYYLVNRAMAL